MLYFAHKLLTEETYKDIRKRLLISNDWIDGIHTTIGNMKEIKRNLELGIKNDYEELSADIIEILIKDQVFQSFALPAKIFSLLFTRTGSGMFYGPHVDSPNKLILYLHYLRFDFVSILHKPFFLLQ